VTAYFNQDYGIYASIDANATNRLFFNGFSSDVFYHTHETGIISGLGVFGQSMNQLSTPVPQSKMSLKYETTQNPIFDPDPAAAKPLSLTNNQHTTLSLHLNLLRFTGPVDIYLAIYAPAVGINEIYFIKSDLTLSPASKEWPKWAENTTGPVDQKFYGDISLSSLPKGEYTFWVLVTPNGNLNNYYLWETKLTN